MTVLDFRVHSTIALDQIAVGLAYEIARQCPDLMTAIALSMELTSIQNAERGYFRQGGDSPAAQSKVAWLSAGLPLIAQQHFDHDSARCCCRSRYSLFPLG